VRGILESRDGIAGSGCHSSRQPSDFGEKAKPVTSLVLLAPNRTQILSPLLSSSTNTGKIRTVSKKKRFFYFLIKPIGKPTGTVPFQERKCACDGCRIGALRTSFFRNEKSSSKIIIDNRRVVLALSFALL
jgi:hypothetical protein